MSSFAFHLGNPAIVLHTKWLDEYRICDDDETCAGLLYEDINVGDKIFSGFRRALENYFYVTIYFDWLKQ